MNYQVVLWSLRMREGEFLGKPAEHARHIVAHTRPGSILLAHDVGDDKRLVALRGLPQMIDELRAKNYQFVTVSRLLGVDQ